MNDWTFRSVTGTWCLCFAVLQTVPLSISLLSTCSTPLVVASQDLTRQEGRELWRDVRAAFESWKVTPSVRTRVLDVTSIVRKYIHPGISFNDAEDILRGAECRMLRRGPHAGPTATPENAYDVEARRWLEDSPFLEKPELTVTLHPRASGDYSAVGKVAAFILIPSL